MNTKKSFMMYLVCVMLMLCINAVSFCSMVKAEEDTEVEIKSKLDPIFSIDDFKDAVEKRIQSTGVRDTIYYRLEVGQSCVQAAEERAADIAAVVKSFQQQGKFANYGAKVGTESGWDLGWGSLHTYTVVSIYDPTGRVLYTIDADNYLGPIIITDHGAVNWNANNTKLVEDVKPNVAVSIAVEGPDTVLPGSKFSLKVVAKDLPAFVTEIGAPFNFLQYQWQYNGQGTAMDRNASREFTAPTTAGDYVYAVTVFYKDYKTNGWEKLARVEHKVTVSAIVAVDWSGIWNATDSKGRFNGQFDLKVDGMAVSGSFISGAGRLPVTGSVNNDKMSLLITFGNPNVINYYLGDMALSQAVGSISAKVVVNLNSESPNRLEGKLYPFNIHYHADETTGAIVITERYSGGKVDPANPERDFAMTR